MAISRSTWLIGRAVWMALLVVFCVFLGLELVFRLLDELDRLGPHYRFVDALVVSGSAMPRRLYLDLPIILLIAVAAGLGGLAQSSELTILRAAGLSRTQIFQRLLWVLSPILILSVVVAETGMPEAEQYSRMYADARSAGGTNNAIWTRDFGRYVFVEGGATGEVRTWKQIEIRETQNDIARIIAADTVDLSQTRVALQDARVLELTPERVVSETQDISQYTRLSASEVRWLTQDPDALALSELWEASSYLHDEGLNDRAHSQLFWQRLLLPVTLVMLALLASATAFGSLRTLSLSNRVFLAVLLGLVFKYAMDMASPAVFLAGGHPALAILIPLLIPLALTPRLLH